MRLEDGYIKKEKFEENVNSKKENWVILVSDNKATTSIAVDNLGVLSKDFKVTLFALNKGKNFKGIKNSFLNRLEFHYPVTSFVDKNSASVIKFENNYIANYGTEPSDFVYIGYDTTYDAIIRIATYQNLNDSFQPGKTKGLTRSFNYIKSNFSSPINNGIQIVKFNNYQIIKVE